MIFAAPSDVQVWILIVELGIIAAVIAIRQIR